MSWLPERRSVLIPAGLVLLLLPILAYRGLGIGRSESLADYGPAPAFELRDHLGRTVRSEELRGKVLVTNFVYTNCRETCPLLSFRMQRLQERLQQEKLLGSHVDLLSFTVDPGQDNPQTLRAYAERYRADPQAWRFLTGPEEAMQQLIVEGFRLGLQKVPPSGGEERLVHVHEDGSSHEHDYDVMHSNRFVLIDRQGRIRAYYDGLELDLERVVRDVRQLLR